MKRKETCYYCLATEFKRFYIKGDHRDEDIKSRQSSHT